MPRFPRSMLLSLALAITTSALATGTPYRNDWSDFSPGSWIVHEWSEAWGDNEPSVERRKTVLLKHRAQGTSTTETYREEDGAWVRSHGGLHGSYGTGSPEVRWSDSAEHPETMEVAGSGRECVREARAGTDTGGEVRVVVWRCPDLDLAVRAIPQWTVSFGWRLGPDVARAVVSRHSPDGSVWEVELHVLAVDRLLRVGEREVTAFVERLVWRQLRADGAVHVTTETTRWLSPEVPGMRVASVSNDPMGRRRVLRALAFEVEAELPAEARSSSLSGGQP